MMAFGYKLLAAAALTIVPNALAAQGAVGDPAAGAKVYANRIEIQADAGQFKAWPSGGTTWHHGIGFIEPFGAAEYFCGENFPEAKAHPLPDWGRGLMKAMTGRDDALLCIYTVKDGSFYVYDSVAGQREKLADGARNQMINIVIGGTGAYQGATGVWLGLTEGRGKPVKIENGRSGLPVLLKIMDGYVKIPG